MTVNKIVNKLLRSDSAFGVINAYDRLWKQSVMNRVLVCFVLILAANSYDASAGTTWSCRETMSFVLDEEGQRLGEEVAKTTQALKWIDEDSVGFNSLKLERSGSRSNTFVHDSSGSSVYLNDKERPYLLVYTQPQTWMNKFGYLRVSFFRCLG